MGPRGGVVTQQSAKLFTPVQFRTWPPTQTSDSFEKSLFAFSTGFYLQGGPVLASRWQVISRPLKTDLAAHSEAHFCAS
jgi:hypothetical protein